MSVKSVLQKDAVVMNYVPFGEKAITMVVSLYQQTAKAKPVIKGNVLKLILEVRLILVHLNFC